MKVYGQLEYAQLEQSIPASISAIGGRIYADITDPAALVPRFYNGTSWKPFLLGGGVSPSDFSSQTANLFLAGPASGSAAAPTFRAPTSSDSTIQMLSAGALLNLGLSCSVGSSALTIALKQNDGSTNASSDNPVVVGFRSATATSGLFNRRTVVGALSVVVPSTATLGHVSAVDQYVWVYLMDNAGTPELAVCGTYAFKDKSIASSTTISGSATSGTVLYSTTGRSNLPIRLIGRLLVNEVTAGTWATAPSDVVIAPTPAVNITDMTSYSPAFVGLGTVSGSAVFQRRVGDCLEVLGKVASGTSTATAVVIPLPSGLTGDGAKYSASASILGEFQVLAGVGTWNTGSCAVGWVFANSSGASNVNLTTSASSGTGLSPVNGNSTASSGQTISFKFKIPITGWSTYGP